jgi:hypothetical protein
MNQVINKKPIQLLIIAFLAFKVLKSFAVWGVLLYKPVQG